ncbi:MAG: HDIG domain-containing protein [Desulfarculaceae bacterium]|jgi:putative nucleotidyltransferase with HDIG domain
MSSAKKPKLRALAREAETPENGRPLRSLAQTMRSEQGRRRLWQLSVLGGIGALLAVAATPFPWSWADLPRLAGLVMVTALFMRVLYGAWFKKLSLRMGGAPGVKDLLLIISLVVMTALLTRGFAIFGEALVQGWTGVSTKSLAVGAPLCAGPLLASLLLGSQAGMLIAVFSGFFASLMWADSGGLFIYFLVAGTVAAHQVKSSRTRSDLIRAGAWASLAGVLMIGGLALYQGWLLSADFLLAWPVAALSGLLGGILAAGLAPLAEAAFGYTTDTKLMELASLDNKLLRELMLKAPGTYHHSLVVSSLVEAAAREIGANHLLAKVAALYHDIGKLKKPDYYVENQGGGHNRHEKLAPSMSALILISHVKEGVELATKHRLGRPIVDIMAQHHGTRLINYFFQKALDRRRQAGGDEPDKEGYRYPGPRPQTREAGLVMLADAVEAATRALKNYTSARIKGVVQSQINNIFAEGQLDECELTLKDLHKIAKTFNRILSGIFHQRLEYPSAPEKAKSSYGDSDPKPSGLQEAGAKGTAETDPADLKRLGMR